MRLESNKKVLLVENDAFFTVKLTRQIEDLGYVVYCSSNVLEAYALLSNCRPDIIISEINIPVIDGFAFLQLVRNSKEHANCIFILIGSTVENELIRKGMLLGADDYLGKPFEGSDLDAAIKARVSRMETVRSNIVFQDVVFLKDTLSHIPVSLTKRESEIFALIANSLSNKEIAEMLRLSPKTVMNHRQRIMDKLGISGNGALYKYAKTMKNKDYFIGNVRLN
jgi:DNA-binding NarL/FixJ family response regulator